jgi:alpha-tubulin suppressor-like RCC1 family protein
MKFWVVNHLMLCGLFFGALLIPGCNNAGTYRLHIEFPDEESKSEISSVHVWVLKPGRHVCEELISGSVKAGSLTSLVDAVLDVPSPDPESLLNEVPAGDALFYAEGQNGNGAILLKGCSPARVAGGKNVDVTVRLLWACHVTSEVEIPQNSLDDNCDGRTDECLVLKDCDDQNICTMDLCINEECQHVPTEDDPEKPKSCVSSDLCLLDKHCKEGECVGTVKDCSSQNGICLEGFCDPATGACAQRVMADGTSCDDGNSCTGSDACANGVCAGTPESTEVICDDFQFCNGTDHCDGSGNCSLHDGSPCTPFFCDEENDNCAAGIGFGSVILGYEHSCGLTADGVAYCWGWNDDGQLGTGGVSQDAQSPLPIDTSAISGNKTFVQLATTGYNHSCGLMADGAAYCWGCDDYGRLGNGDGLGDSLSPSPVDTSTISGNKAFVQLIVGGDHTCGLMADGTAYCWGYENVGQLGNGGTSESAESPSPVDTSTMSGNKAFVSLSAGRWHNCGLTADGVAYCWGWDDCGQLGDGGTLLDTESPSLVDTSTILGNKAFVQLSAGYEHTCGLTADGVAYCWGSDYFGQLGNGDGLGDSPSPSPVDTSAIGGNKTFLRLTAGNAHTCGLTADGVAYCWGMGDSGQLGNGGTAQNAQSPSPVDTSTVAGNKVFVQLSAGVEHTCGVTADGAAYCWGSDYHGQLGNSGTPQSTGSPSLVDTSALSRKKQFVKLAAGIDYACGLTSTGAVHCWGHNDFGQLGIGSALQNAESPLPVDTSTIPGNKAFVQLDTGVSHTCALTADFVAYCWGRDVSGELGNGGTSQNTLSPSPVDTSTISGNKTFVQLAGGQDHSCGLTADGVGYCWGSDGYGRLGNGSGLGSSQSPSPIDTSPIPGNKTFVQLVTGDYHTCGLTVGGVAYCWGYDNFGQLGNGGASLDTQSPSPVDTSTISGNKTFVRLSAGRWHTCGLMADGAAYCWGYDTAGELGNGGASQDTQSPSPVDTSTVPGNKAFLKLTAGDAHTCGLTADGAGYCWGADGHGQLGDGDGLLDAQSPSPVDISTVTGNKAFVQFALGLFHTCALTAEAVAYCWGEDENGQLGNGSSSVEDTQSPSPVDTSGI